MTWINDFKKLMDIVTSRTTLGALVAVYVIYVYVNKENALDALRDFAMISIGFLLKATSNGDK